jgi:hypothetical protein
VAEVETGRRVDARRCSLPVRTASLLACINK